MEIKKLLKEWTIEERLFYSDNCDTTAFLGKYFRLDANQILEVSLNFKKYEVKDDSIDSRESVQEM